MHFRLFLFVLTKTDSVSLRSSGVGDEGGCGSAVSSSVDISVSVLVSAETLPLVSLGVMIKSAEGLSVSWGVSGDFGELGIRG